MNNQLIIVGRAGQDPKKIDFPSGKSVVKFSVAVREYAGGEEDKTLWVDVEAWNGVGENVLSTVTKGREGLFQGRLGETTFNGKDGAAITKPVLRLSSFHLTGKKNVEPAAATAGRESRA